MNESTDTIQERSESYAFTLLEVARLATYRAAVKTGFYSDTCDDMPAFHNLTNLTNATDEATDSLSRLFDSPTIQRLDSYRLAVESGLFDGDEMGR
jgi:hypothetical protein